MNLNLQPSLLDFNWFNCDLYSASLFGEEFYLKKIWVAIKFLAVYLYQLITSSISTINYILFKTNEVNPGLLTYETSLKSNWAITF